MTSATRGEDLRQTWLLGWQRDEGISPSQEPSKMNHVARQTTREVASKAAEKYLGVPADSVAGYGYTVRGTKDW